MLKWEKLSLRRKQQKALIMYKSIKELIYGTKTLITWLKQNSSNFQGF